jgi:hypothetical protein
LLILQTATANTGEKRPGATPAAATSAPDIASASIPDTLATLQVNPDAGLSRAEVDRRRGQHGFNEVAVEKGHPVRLFLAKFWGLSAWMLELIMLLSLALRRHDRRRRQRCAGTASGRSRTMLYFGIFSARERRWFWSTMPSRALMAALAADALVGTALTFVGLPDLMPLLWWQTLAILGYAMISCLIVNDAIKVAMIKWRVPLAVA